MKEYTIKRELVDEVSASEAENRMSEEGIILVYDEKELIGSVVATDSGRMIINTIWESDEEDTLAELMEIYPRYAFKLKTNDE